MLSVSKLLKRQGQRVLYDNATFQLRANDRVGLVGANGVGKTTIFRVITGEEPADGGTVAIDNGVVVSYFSQDIGDLRGRSALEEVKAGVGAIGALEVEIQKAERRLDLLAEDPLSDAALEELMSRYGEAQAEYQRLGGYDLEARAKEVLTGLGIGPSDHDTAVEHFSGGWKMRIALAKILVQNPDVLLLDEPTNHLDIESIVWLEGWLQAFKGAFLLTSHDREFMNRLCNRIAEIADKKLTVYTGNYEYYLRERELRREQAVAAFRRQQEMLSKEEDFIARFGARASHAAQVQSRVKKIDKIERLELPTETKTIRFSFQPPPRSGNDVIEFNNLGKVWTKPDGSPRRVFQGLAGMVRRQDKIAVTGVNGAGKSTFLKTLIGHTEASEGMAKLGSQVHVGYFGQHALDQLNSDETVFEAISHRLPDLSHGYCRNLLGAFLFSGEEVDKKIGVLSGGERSRVALALILASPLNLLVLDEPTNHLDIGSREVLLEALQSFEGTVLVVSHDRHFLRQVVNRVFSIDAGKLEIYDGSFDEYLASHR